MMIAKQQTIVAALFATLFVAHASGNLLSAEPEGYIDCPLCANETFGVYTYGTFIADSGVVSCQEAFDTDIRLPPENCTAWQSRGEDVCRCAAEPPENHDCKLCDDGGSLPEGALAAIPGTFCAQLQVDATRDFQDRCPIWQQTMGNYCGCNNTYDASICRICTEGYKFDPAKVVDGLDNSTISCGRLEFSANLASGDFGCREYQFIFESQCCEKIEEALPDISGTTGASVMMIGSVVVAAFGVLNMLL
ncbi:unnamed protein product [Cylindrotheca closterium]|uniref:RanBP2-type domain-containing protein n=1 Tax=Cylindrotheca closterium TaxID=2856 RepID=A0AAD2CXH2_9STRA|nr:unnamed protein product [Cylindrotheca closterium]